MHLVKEINNRFTNLGVAFSYLLVSLLSIILMLFPGLLFSYVLIKFVWFLMGQDFISTDKLIIFTLAGIVSWYLGLGLSKITKDVNSKERGF